MQRGQRYTRTVLLVALRKRSAVGGKRVELTQVGGRQRENQRDSN